jgi:MinD-like ATPase involved in chromosome partitioning or flagellar assembly
VDLPDLAAAAAAGRGALALISATLAGVDRESVELLRSYDVRVLVVAPDSDVAPWDRLGADAVVSPRQATDVDALLHCLASLAARTDASPPAPPPVAAPAAEESVGDAALLAVWGPAGAPGRSTVALGIATASAASGLPTLLIDADVYGGATGQMLAVLDEVSGVLATARLAAAGALDCESLAAEARTTTPNLRILTGLPRADRWPALRPAVMREILAVARRSAALVVVDCGFCVEHDEQLSYDTAAPQRNGATTTVLAQADLVVVVGSADPLGLTRLSRARSELRELLPMAVVRLVVNRVRDGVRGGVGWSADEVAATLLRAMGEVPLGFLPLDQQAVDSAWMRGCAVGEGEDRSPLALALRRLAADLVQTLGLREPPAVRSSRWRRRSPALTR